MKKEPADSLTEKGLLELFERAKRPLSMNDLKKMVALWKERKNELKKLLRDMVRAGSLIRLKNDRFGIPDEMNLLLGTLWCTRSGNGFVVPDRGEGGDVFVPARFIKDAIHGDKVVVRIEHVRQRRREGRIVKVTERKTKNITGFLRQHKTLFFLVPDDERISAHFIVEPGKKTGELRDGDLVAAKVTRFADGGDPECSILKLFRNLDSIGKITQFVTYKQGLSGRFPRTVENETKQMGLDISTGGRVDLRALDHVTIDGEFARDFDDAVCVEKTGKGFVLYVSIADVSHYVRRDSAADREAFARGTSVYFPGAVIPMLPRKLSNIVCSLNPEEERLTVTVRLRYDRAGNLLQASFDRSVIRSSRRLTYHQVEDGLVKKEAKARRALGPLLRRLEDMGELAHILKGRREDRGNLDFDLPEPDLVLDMEGGIKTILRSERLFSQSIIEEFMIAANEAVARFITEQKVPLIYRVHEHPEREKLADFERLLRTLGIGCKTDSRGRLPLQSILRDAREKEHEFLISRILLKSMKQARYSALNKGHFGLALDLYSHFTSPIRRYPDLVCHRILKAIIGDGGKGKAPYGEEDLERMAIHLSERERAAMEAERETEDRVKVLFMKEKVGREYEGIISHITSFGFFVELFDVFVEGLVLLSSLYDDYYTFEEQRFRLVGRKTHRVFRIGDHVRVGVEMADPEKNLLHFALLKTPGGGRPATSLNKTRRTDPL
ncbi:MAG: ribonuclease R [Syntrophorhabdales bacterium]|jgi:ribonuclease R